MSNYYELFGIKKNKNDKRKIDLVDELLKVPKTEKGKSVPHTEVLKESATHQADLLFLPHDKKFRYALVVVDLATRALDAEPLKTKNPSEVSKAIHRIYKRKHLSFPTILQVDSGSEFKGAFAQLLKKRDIHIRVAKTGRHRAQAMVETLNGMISKALNRAMTVEEEKSGKQSNEWVDNLPHLVRILNERQKRPPKDPTKAGPPTCSGSSCNIIKVGTKVRLILEHPVMNVTGERITGKFRAGDRRWTKKVYSIKSISLRPDQPPMYLIEGVPDIAFTKAQIQVIKDQSQDSNKFIVEKFIGKKSIKRKVHYLVKWKNYPKGAASWEPRSNLIEDLGKDLFNEHVARMKKS